MRRLICLIAVLLIGITAFSQKPNDKSINFTDNKGKKQGYWKKIGEDGSIKYEGRFKNNTPYGEFRYYYPKNILKAVSHFSPNGKVSYTTSFHQNGKVMAKGKYVSEKKDSTWVYYDEDGKLIATENYKSGVKNGAEISYFADGSISEKINWGNGKKEGIWLQFFPDSSKKVSAFYKNDQLEGIANYYFPDGTIMVFGSYKKGHREGEWIYNNEKGETEKKEIYSNGSLIKEEILIKRPE